MAESQRLTTSHIVRAHFALGQTLGRLGDLLGVSKRTAQRMVLGQSSISPGSAMERTLVHAVATKDLPLAQELSAWTGVALPVDPPKPPPVAEEGPKTPPLPLDLVVDSVVCHAAEAGGLSPAVMRPALQAGLARLLELGVPLDQLVAFLGEKSPEKPKAAKKPSR